MIILHGFFKARKAATRPAKSAGQGDSKCMLLCKLGCWNPKIKACSAWRENPVASANAASSSGFLARGPGAAILGIADQRVAQMGQMHPDLMGAPGFQPALDQGGDRPFLRTKCLQ